LRAKEDDRQQKKLFQFLSAIGAKALRFHLGRVQEMAKSSSDRYTYERKIAERFGGQQELELIVPAKEPPRRDLWGRCLSKLKRMRPPTEAASKHYATTFKLTPMCDVALALYDLGRHYEADGQRNGHYPNFEPHGVPP
jgi:hypothetical protein